MRFFRYTPALGAIPWLLHASSLHAAPNADPAPPAPASSAICSAGEFEHKIAAGDTMLRVAEHYYCKQHDTTAEEVAEWLEDHNASRLGKNRKVLQPGGTLCLPSRFRGANWTAERCWPEQATTDPPRAVVDTPAHEPTESQITASGADAVAKTNTATSPAPNPSPRIESTTTTPIQIEPASNDGDRVSRTKPKPLTRVSAEIMGGVFVPLSEETRSEFYPSLGVAALGARITIGFVEVAARGIFVGTNQSVMYNEKPQQEQTIAGGGANAQVGIALRRGRFRFIPGVEAGWLSVKRSVTRSEFWNLNKPAQSTIDLAVAGVFLRPEYQFDARGRLSVAIEVGGDIVAYDKPNDDVNLNVNGRIAGGVGYAF